MHKIKNSSNVQAGIQGIYISAPVKEKPPSGVTPLGGFFLSIQKDNIWRQPAPYSLVQYLLQDAYINAP